MKLNLKSGVMGNKTIEFIFSMFTQIAFTLSIILFSILAHNFISISNFMNILNQVSFVAILSLGLCVVMITNDFDLSVAGIMGLASAVCAVLLNLGIPVPIAMLAACATGLLLGMINAFFVVNLKIVSILSTLALSYMCSGLELTLEKGTWVPAKAYIFELLRDGKVGPIPIPVIVLIVVFLLFYYLMNRTTYGRYMYAIGGNIQAAITAGIKVKTFRYSGFMLAGFAAAIASFLLIARIGGATPHGGELSLMDAFLANFVGQSVSRQRVYNISGTFIGAIFAGILTNGFTLMGVHAFHVYLVKGVIIILIVAISTVYKRGVI